MKRLASVLDAARGVVGFAVFYVGWLCLAEIPARWLSSLLPGMGPAAGPAESAGLVFAALFLLWLGRGVVNNRRGRVVLLALLAWTIGAGLIYFSGGSSTGLPPVATWFFFANSMLAATVLTAGLIAFRRRNEA